MRVDDVAVLCSGGLDSAVLVAHEATSARVHPIYVSAGLSWEREELALLGRLLASPPYATNVEPLTRLSVALSDLYPATHWSLNGTPPAYDTPDEDVYLPGRNVLLLSKASVLCAARGVHRIAVGPLAGNPFPDATPQFFTAMERALTLGLGHEVRIEAPFARLHKEDVIRLGARLGVPFHLTLSCMNPTGGRHCGLCSKCRERRDGFAGAGIDDPTDYIAAWPR
ncbi:MAG: 7-cyano-7-deazaguanine synthase [Acidobacteria bacterium]|nr:MAG: 7-cyano-7-deazaguanine synthase [Acidobacteriota bacterium]